MAQAGTGGGAAFNPTIKTVPAEPSSTPKAGSAKGKGRAHDATVVTQSNNEPRS